MADRYLRASGNWNGPVWAATSSGVAGSAATPTVNDDVYIAANFTVTLTADASCRKIFHTNGTINLNSYKLSLQFDLQSFGSISRTINLGSGTLELLHGGLYLLDSNLTFNAGTSLVIFNMVDGGFTNDFETSNKTFNDVVINMGQGDNYSYQLDITGSPTFRSLIIQSRNSAAHTVNFDSGATITTNKFVAIGSSESNRLSLTGSNTSIELDESSTSYGQNVSINGVRGYDGSVDLSKVPAGSMTIIDGSSSLDDWYNAGDGSLDTSSYVTGSSSIKVTTQSASSFAAVQVYYATPYNISDDNFRFYVKISDIAAYNHFTVILASDGYSFANTYTLDIRTRLVNAPSNEWIEVVVPRSAFIKDGSPNWASINSIMIRTRDNGTKRISINFDSMLSYPQSSSGVVSITFDDGYSDAYDYALPKLNEYGFVATAFVPYVELGTPGFMTEAQVDGLHSSGWSIGGHFMQNLTTLDSAQLTSAITGIADFLETKKYRGREHFAYPNGAYNQTVNDTVYSRFKYGYNIDGWNNSNSYVSTKRVNRQSIDMWTTVQMVKDWIDSAKANNEWLILNFHTLVDTLVDGQDWKKLDFNTIVDYLASENIRVSGISEMFAGKRYIGKNSVQSGRDGWLLQDPPKISTLVDPLTIAPGSNPNWTVSGTVTQVTTGHDGGGYKLAGGAMMVSTDTFDLVEDAIVIERIDSPTGNPSLDIGDGSATLTVDGFAGAEKGTVTEYSNSSNTAGTSLFSYPLSGSKFTRLSLVGKKLMWQVSDGGTGWTDKSNITIDANSEDYYRSVRISVSGGDYTIGSINPELAQPSTGAFLPFFIP